MNPVAELLGVSRRYAGPPPVTALRECTLTIKEGDFLTVTGASGSGKSTLLNVLGLLDKPTEGTYRFRGRDTTSLTENERARLRGSSLGFVFQAFHLLEHRTCLENVALAGVYTGESERQSRKAAEAALAAVGLADRLGSFPTALSGGQQQRVAIARGIATDPHILLCDEPTGNLDSATAESILNLLQSLHSGGRTIVLITHNEKVAGLGTRMLSISDGQIHEQDPSERPK